jgi:non-specific serine/threonine protein kinase
VDRAAARGRRGRPEVLLDSCRAGRGAGGGERRLTEIETPPSFAGRLRPYQQRGLAWLSFLSSLGLGACLADDMGLGKTPQTLALLLAERERRAGGRRARVGPTLLVCPMSVVGNWQREAERFAPSLRVLVHHGTERLRGRAFASAARRADLVITTYALVTRDREAIAQVKWERLALDEAQNIKTSDAKQTRAIRSLPARHRDRALGDHPRRADEAQAGLQPPCAPAEGPLAPRRALGEPRAARVTNASAAGASSRRVVESVQSIQSVQNVRRGSTRGLATPSSQTALQ